MRQIQTARLVLALFAIVLLGYGIRYDASPYRWGGIACLAMAVILRFFGRGRQLD